MLVGGIDRLPRDGEAGQTIKTGGGQHGKEAVAYIFNNTLWGDGSGISMMNTLSCVMKNNLLADRQRINRPEVFPQSVFEGNSIASQPGKLGSGLITGPIAFKEAEAADFTPVNGKRGGAPFPISSRNRPFAGRDLVLTDSPGSFEPR